MRSWLKKDALNRAWREFSHGVVAVVLVPGAIAAFGVLQAALTGDVTAQGFEWGIIGRNMLLAAEVAVTMSVVAYLHRLKLDPSRFPSLEPPTPPAQPPTMAQR